ncbi:MAG: TipJ family phage tail tip protein [Glycocaulis sp.]
MPDGSDFQPASSARLALGLHPMAAPGEPRPVRPGQTLSALMDEAVPDPVLRAHFSVTLDGRPVPQGLWEHTVLAEGQLINACLVPAGGDDSRKFIRTVLQFAVMAAALWVGGGAGGAIASKWLASAAAATVSIAGNLAINALVPLPQPGFGDAGERFSPAYYPETARNEAALYQPVRVPFGEHRFFPALQALPVQESVGEDVYLRYLLSLGPMPLQIDPATIRIGETPLSEFEGVDFELRLKPDDPPITLYTGDVFQLSVGALLEGPSAWTTRTTQPDVTEIAVVLGFRAGLGAKDSKNNNQPVTVAIEIEYRPAGTSEPYRSVLATATQANTAVGELATDRLRYGDDFATLEEFALAAAAQPGAQTGAVSLTRREPGKPFRHVARAAVPKGQYDVRVRRTSNESTDERTADSVHWEFLDSIRALDPNPIEMHAVMALRIKGSNQLSGAIDTINMTARRMAPTLDPDMVSGDAPDFSAVAPEDWQGVSATRNNADACLFVLQGPMVARKVADSAIHWPSLAAFWKWCDVNGFHFDFILDRPMRRDDMLQMICAAARCRPVRVEGQYRFVIDAERSGGPVQVFTGLNVRNFRIARTWPQPVHALRIPFLNRENDYRQDERILYLPGYSADGAGDTIAASLFERLELVGVTDPEIIARLGYFHAATALSQTERYSFEIPDAEGLTALHGDLIALQHDVLVTGLGAARVRSRTLNGSGNVVSVEIDTSVTLEEGVDYGLVRRRIEGTGGAPGRVRADPAIPLAAVTEETAGETATLTLAAPVDASIAPDIGEMVIIGETGKEYLEGLLKGTRGVDHWGAGVEAVAYAPNRFGAGEGVMPPFDPKVTLPVDRRPAAPLFTGIEITDEGIAIAFDIVSGRTRPLARFDIGWRLHAAPGEESPFEALPSLPGTARVAIIPPGEPAERYDASIVAVDREGRQSDPLLVLDISASDALAPVTNALAEGVLSGSAGGGARLPRLRVSCDPVERSDVDVIHIEARPAGGLDTDWRVRDWLAPAEPQKDIANVDPGELIDVAFRARTRRGVYAPRVIVAAVQIPEELIASDANALNGVDATEVLADIAELFWDVENLAVEFADGIVAVEEAVLSTRQTARNLLPGTFEDLQNFADVALPVSPPLTGVDQVNVDGLGLGVERADTIKSIVTAGALEVRPNRKYRVTSISRRSEAPSAESGNRRHRLFLRGYDASGALVLSTQLANTGTLTDADPRTLTADIDSNDILAASGSPVRVRPNLLLHEGFTGGKSQAFLLLIEDITESAAATVARNEAVGAKTDAEGFASAAAGFKDTAEAEAGSASASATTATLAAAEAATNSARAERATLLRASGGAIGGDVFGRAPEMLTGSVIGDPDTRADLVISAAQWQLLDPLSAYPGGIFSLAGKASNTMAATKAVVFARVGDKIEVKCRARSLATANPGTLLTLVIRRLDGTFADVGAAVLGTMDATIGGLQEFRATFTVTNAADRAFKVYAVHPAGAVARVDLYHLSATVLGANVAEISTAMVGPDGKASARWVKLTDAAGSTPSYVMLESGDGTGRAAIVSPNTVFGRPGDTPGQIKPTMYLGEDGVVYVEREIRMDPNGAYTIFSGSTPVQVFGKDPTTGKRGFWIRKNNGDPLLVINATDQIFQLYPDMAIDGFAGVEQRNQLGSESMMSPSIPNTNPVLSHFPTRQVFTSLAAGNEPVPNIPGMRVRVSFFYEFEATADIFDWFYWRVRISRETTAGSTIATIYDGNRLWNVSQATSGASGNAASNAYPISRGETIEVFDTIPSPGNAGGYTYRARLDPIASPGNATTPVEGFNKATTRIFNVKQRVLIASAPRPGVFN